MRQRGREEQQQGGVGNGMSEILAAHVRKVTRFREGGEEVLEREVRRLEWSGEARKKGPRAESGEKDDEGADEGGEGDIVERTPQRNDRFKKR